MKDNNLQLSQLDATMAEAAQMATDGTGVLTAEAKEKLDACLIDMKAEYPANKFLYSVDGVPVITQSDIHTIGAKQKGGKTSLVSILISAAIAGQWNRVKCLDDDISVLYVDTEMKKVDTQLLGLKAARMAGVDADALAEHVHMVNFRPLTPAEMEVGIGYFINVYKRNMERKALVDAAKSKLGKGRSTIYKVISAMKSGNGALIIEDNGMIKLNTF